MRNARELALVTAVLALPASIGAQQPVLVGETRQETAQAYGNAPGGSSVGLNVTKLTDTSGFSSVTLSYTVYGAAYHHVACSLPAEAFQVAKAGRNPGEAAISLTAHSPYCDPAPAGPVEIRFVPVPGELDESHRNGERTVWGVRYRVQQWVARWDVEMWGTFERVSIGPVAGETSVKREVTEPK